MKENLNDFVAFMTVARERSFTRAAAQMGVSQSALSRTIRALEQQMGLPLLVRTTRSVSLTEGGERLILALEPRFAEIRAELDSLRALTDRAAGKVRITSTNHATMTYVWPRLKALVRDNPELKIEIVDDYALKDIVADRFDIGVRLGDEIAQDMIAARIAPDLTMAIVGATEYLASRPKIRNPQDLMQHNCINLRLPTMNSLLPWELIKGERQLQVRVDGQLTFNSTYQIVEAALDGFGLGYVPKDIVEPYVAARRLKWVLKDWFPTYVGLHVYYPSRHKSSRAVELVVTALKDGYRDSLARR